MQAQLPARTPLVRIPWHQQKELLFEIAEPVAVFLGLLLLLLTFRRGIFRRVRHRAGDSSIAPLLLSTLELPADLWCAAASLAIALRVSSVPPNLLAWAHGAIVTFVIISFTLVAASVALRAAMAVGERRGMPIAESGLSRSLIRVLIFSLGATVLAAYLGISITPLLTALGVGGIAVALALQDTLANFFAGIYIVLEEPMKVGDVVRLSTGEEGTVSDIGWRTTRLRTAQHTAIVIPNTRITSGILTNYAMPVPHVGVEMPVYLAQDAGAEHAMRAILEECRATHGVLGDPAPQVHFHPGYLPTHIQLTLAFTVAGHAQQVPVQSELKLRLLERFRQDSIPLPQVPLKLPQLDTTLVPGTKP